MKQWITRHSRRLTGLRLDNGFLSHINEKTSRKSPLRSLNLEDSRIDHKNPSGKIKGLSIHLPIRFHSIRKPQPRISVFAKRHLRV